MQAGFPESARLTGRGEKWALNQIQDLDCYTGLDTLLNWNSVCNLKSLQNCVLWKSEQKCCGSARVFIQAKGKVIPTEYILRDSGNNIWRHLTLLPVTLVQKSCYGIYWMYESDPISHLCNSLGCPPPYLEWDLNFSHCRYSRIHARSVSLPT